MFENMNENHIVYSTDSTFKSNLTSEPKTPLLIKQDLRIHLIRLKGDKLVTVVRGFKGQNKNLKTSLHNHWHNHSLKQFDFYFFLNSLLNIYFLQMMKT